METRICVDCGREFPALPWRGTLPKRCPQCLDVRQKRPSVVVERNLLWGPIICQVESLPPAQWEKVQGTDRDVPSYRLLVKGEKFGASWSGRIDIFAPRPIEVGEVVSLAEVEAVHRVRIKQTFKPTVYGSEVPVVQHFPLSSEIEGSEVVLEARRYIRLDPAEAEGEANLPRLVWREARWKTTLKGFGRQYAYELRGAPLWEARVRGSYRSGRAGTEAALAIVDEDHPLEVACKFDH